MEQSFTSNGKLLLTGEYVVLDGAKSLAIPTIYGQNLKAKPTSNDFLHWKSYDHKQQLWYEDRFSLLDFVPIQTSNPVSLRLKNIFEAISEQNPFFLNNGFEITTFASFPKEWGLGTSSTLINNLAQWSNTNAYLLLEKTFGGSGYDIASAQNNQPIIYKRKETLPEVKTVQLEWPFKQNLFFIYLNRKQNSRDGIKYYRQHPPHPLEIEKISHLTDEIIKAESLKEFQDLLNQHEALLSKILCMPTVKSTHFPDFKGAIKSLGAWGGDFILVAQDHFNKDYFINKGFNTIIPFQKMIKPINNL